MPVIRFVWHFRMEVAREGPLGRKSHIVPDCHASKPWHNSYWPGSMLQTIHVHVG